MEFEITAINKQGEECHVVAYGVGSQKDAAEPDNPFYFSPKNSTFSFGLKTAVVTAMGWKVGSVLTLGLKEDRANGQ